MNFLTRTAMPRRTFLQGLGATVALPYLDSMVPTLRRFGGAPDAMTRLLAIESVHGAAGSNATRGFRIIGSGSLGPAQLIVSV